MTLPKLNLTPSASGYSVQPLSTADYKDGVGGLPMVHEDSLNLKGRVRLSWTIDVSNYAVFKTFFDTTLKEGTLPDRSTRPCLCPAP
jgi:hypothetical protein